MGTILELLTTTNLENIDSLNIVKEYYNFFSYTFYCNLINHLSITYNINGLGAQLIKNKLNNDSYIEDNVIKYKSIDNIKCDNSCNSITYTKNIATFNNIYTSEFSKNIFDDYNLTYYMVQIGDMVFYIDNGSILDVLINEENFYIPASEGTIVSYTTGTSSTGYTNGWQTITPDAGFDSYQVTEIELQFDSPYYQYQDANGTWQVDWDTPLTLDLKIDIYDTYTANSVNPWDRFDGLTPIATAVNNNVDANSNTFVFDSPISTTGTLYFWIKENSTNITQSPLGVDRPIQISIYKSGNGPNDGGAGNNWGRLNHVVRGMTPEEGHPDLLRVEEFSGKIIEWFDNYLKWYGGEFKRTLKVSIDSLYLYLKKFKERNNI